MKNYMAGYWKFDEGSGTTASDNSGTAPPNTGTLTNMDTATVWVAGKSGRALKFDGVNDYVNVPDSASLTISGPITVSAWVNFKSFTNIIEAIASKNAVSNGWTLEKEAASNALSFWINSANRATTDVLSLNTWYHITGTFDGSNIKIYRDGVRKATTAQGSSTASAGSLRIGVAALDANRFFDGVIDEVKIYNKAIGDVNIQPGSSGLVINYPGLEGKHAIKIGTSSNVAEAGVTCV
ncbi:MAG: LamG domain-containing protein [Candidatus Aenigmarchaeota archaeon]|nr:LamG domain-containing protein [Candidatus Aenigmarchaeota archaeon]